MPKCSAGPGRRGHGLLAGPGAHAGRHLRMLKAKWPKKVFGHELCDLLVLDEASQMRLPEALMAALPLTCE